MAITDKNTLKLWFKNLMKPTQDQFWAWMDSFWHKDEKIPASRISGLEALGGDTSGLMGKPVGLADGRYELQMASDQYSWSPAPELPDMSTYATIDYVNGKITAVYRVKGSVASVAALPAGATAGDVYNTLDTGDNYVWTGFEWDKLSGLVDLSGYFKKTETYSRTEMDNRYQPKGNYITDVSGKVDKPATDGTWVLQKSGSSFVWVAASSAGSNVTIADNVTTQDATQALSAKQGYLLDQNKVNKPTQDGIWALQKLGSQYVWVAASSGGGPVDAWTKTESDGRYQPKGNYITALPTFATINNQRIDEGGNITIAEAGPSVTVNNTLTSTSTSEALSAQMGKVLNDGKLNKPAQQTADRVILGDGTTKPISEIQSITNTTVNEVIDADTIIIDVASSFDTSTVGSQTGKTQQGRNVQINNGVNNVVFNILTNAHPKYNVTFTKLGAGSVQIVAGSDVTIEKIDYMDVCNGVRGSRFHIERVVGTNTFLLYMANYE